MTSRISEPIDRLTFDAARLMAEHPPIWRDPNKRIVYGISCPAGSVHRGTIHYTRWPAMPLPQTIDAAAAARRVEGREGYYDYASVPQAGAGVEWHVNFADPLLFVAYGSPLFAQDEMQVAEHPALGALHETLQSMALPTVTQEDDRPTPVLVTGVERRCRVTPQALYGNAFARAAPEAVRRATTPIDPPTITNLIAMAAPAGGFGRYRAGTIERILTTAFTGFRAAALESARHHGERRPILVHTGFWGCGAFGGNRVLMSLLQILAAEMAGVERLVFHTGGRGSGDNLRTAIDLIKGDLATAGGMKARNLIDQIAGLGFDWGVSDGN